MDFGVVIQTNPPAWRTVGLAKQAEEHGFDYVWTFDSHLLWQEPYVIYSQILAETRRIIVGPMVTNPATRDWTVTASVFATLNEMYGNRTVVGIGRGDSAVRVLNGKPTTLKEVRDATHVIRELGNCRPVEHNGSTLQFPWARTSALEVWIAAYGPLALKTAGEAGDGFILQLADVDVAKWMIGRVREAAEKAGRDPEPLTFCVAAPAYVGAADEIDHMRSQTRWFGGMVGNHIADIVSSTARRRRATRASRRCSSTTSRAAPATTTTPTARPTTTTSTSSPTRSSTGSASSALPSSTSPSSRSSRRSASTSSSIYLQHDNKEETMRVYGESVMPPPARARDGEGIGHWSARTGPAGVLGILGVARVRPGSSTRRSGPRTASVGDTGCCPAPTDLAMPHVLGHGAAASVEPTTRLAGAPPLCEAVLRRRPGLARASPRVGWLVGVAVGHAARGADAAGCRIAECGAAAVDRAQPDRAADRVRPAGAPAGARRSQIGGLPVEQRGSVAVIASVPRVLPGRRRCAPRPAVARPRPTSS